jgi:hypothetical protein
MSLTKRTLFALALLTGAPAIAQIPPEIAKTLTIVDVRRNDSFGVKTGKPISLSRAVFQKLKTGPPATISLLPYFLQENELDPENETGG